MSDTGYSCLYKNSETDLINIFDRSSPGSIITGFETADKDLGTIFTPYLYGTKITTGYYTLDGKDLGELFNIGSPFKAEWFINNGTNKNNITGIPTYMTLMRDIISGYTGIYNDYYFYPCVFGNKFFTSKTNVLINGSDIGEYLSPIVYCYSMTLENQSLLRVGPIYQQVPNGAKYMTILSYGGSGGGGGVALSPTRSGGGGGGGGGGVSVTVGLDCAAGGEYRVYLGTGGPGGDGTNATYLDGWDGSESFIVYNNMKYCIAGGGGGGTVGILASINGKGGKGGTCGTDTVSYNGTTYNWNRPGMDGGNGTVIGYLNSGQGGGVAGAIYKQNELISNSTKFITTSELYSYGKYYLVKQGQLYPELMASTYQNYAPYGVGDGVGGGAGGGWDVAMGNKGKNGLIYIWFFFSEKNFSSNITGVRF